MWLHMIIILFTLLAFGIIIYHIVVPQLFPKGIPIPLTIISAFGYLIGISLLVAAIVLYNREEERSTRATYLKWARELGGNEAVLRKIERYQYGSRKIPGIWGEVKISYKNREFIFAAENVVGSSGLGCLPFFVITIGMDEECSHMQENPLAQLGTNTKKLLGQIKKQLRGVELMCEENRYSLRIPITSSVTSYHLRTAMEILLSIATSV